MCIFSHWNTTDIFWSFLRLFMTQSFKRGLSKTTFVNCKDEIEKKRKSGEESPLVHVVMVVSPENQGSPE